MNIAREVESLLTNIEDAAEARRAVAAAVRPFQASYARVVVATALASLEDGSRELALPIVERLPLRCRPSSMAMPIARPVSESGPASVLSAEAPDDQATVGRKLTMVKDTALVTLAEAQHAIGFSRSRLKKVLKRMAVKPIYVGRIGYVPGSIVNMLARTHREWRRTENCRDWQKKTGYEWSAAR